MVICCTSDILNFNQNQNFYQIKKSVKNDDLFEDDLHEEVFGRRNLPRGGAGVEWLRPPEICERLRGSDEGKLPVMGGANRKSINQGELGDCWFLSALAGLAENKHLFQTVVPPGQNFGSRWNRYRGVFRFRFFRKGKQYEVVIDDRLPTRQGHLIYLKGGQANEFWPALFEKAYAKFYGGYNNIVGGKSMEAGVDFTGGIAQRVGVESYLRTPGQGPEKLHHLLQLSHQSGALISATLGGPHVQEAVDQRLQRGHAYTLTGITKVRGGRGGRLVIPLIRLRDPHGSGISAEWSGDWGDASGLWAEIPARMRRRIRNMEKDGEFYVSYNKDFLRYFTDIDLIHLNPLRLELNEDRQTRKFLLAELEGRWRRGEAGASTAAQGYQNFHKNPQFRFSLANCRDKNSDCTVVITLSQIRQNRSEEKAQIGFTIYKDIPSGPLDREFARNAHNQAGDSGAFVNSRDVSSSFLLAAGNYCVVPSTYRTEESGEFYLRLFVDTRWRCRVQDQEGVEVSLGAVRDYKASSRAGQRCRSLARTLLCCQCYCCCCCPAAAGSGSTDGQYSEEGQQGPVKILRN